MSLCACMGPQGDDPVCPCKMRAAGKKPTSYWNDESREQLRQAFVRIQYVEEKMNLDTAIQKLTVANVANCNCTTKTPEIVHHERNCPYRLISETITMLQNILDTKE